jgi:multidrug resistance efflux pump
MDELNDGLKIYSEEVRDVLSDPPNKILRWGNTILFGFVFILFILSYLIKYPDVIATQIVITTNIPPQKLIAKISGKIEVILIKDQAFVSKNTPLAVIENTANYKDVFLLKSVVDTINIDKGNFPFELLKSVQLGDIESSFAMFQKESQADYLNTKLQPFQVQGTAQSYEAIQLKERLSLLESQKNINQNELVLQKSDLNRYQSLFDKGIIAAQELEKHKLNYLLVERNYKSLLSNISSLKSSLIELNRNSKTNTINENKENVNLQRNVIQAFYQLKKAIKDWELNYVLRASISGKVSFLQLCAENQFVNAGENVFAVIPNNESGYIGKVKAQSLNSGKIKLGQNVNIRLANFPDREFGMLLGKIKNISLTPDKDGNLLIDVSLPHGLATTYKKQITFQQEMTGSAEIITEDLRLLERILYQFRDVFRI